MTASILLVGGLFGGTYGLMNVLLKAWSLYTCVCVTMVMLIAVFW